MSSSLAEGAKETASSLLTCFGRPNYSEQFSAFATVLIKELLSCFVSQYTSTCDREAMWGSYYQLRSKNLWVTFVQQAIRKTPSPLFYQHVTHFVFKLLMKNIFVYLSLIVQMLPVLI